MKDGAEVHQILLGSGILIIEGLALQDVEEGIYDMICLPLKIKSADGSPARVIIRKADS
jgi:arylformamidase